MGGGNYEDISTHSVCSKLPHSPHLPRLTLALRSNPWLLSNTLNPTTSLSSSRRIAGICSSTQSQRQAEQRFSPAILFKLTHIGSSTCYTGIHTSYCICERQYPWFRRHCPQGRHQATTLRRLDPREPARAARSRRMGQVSQSRSCIAKRGRRRCSGRSARETRRVICLLRAHLCNLQSFGLSSLILLLV